MAVLKKCQMRIGSRYLIEIEINVDNIIFFCYYSSNWHIGTYIFVCIKIMNKIYNF